HRDFKAGISWPLNTLADDQDYLRLGEPCDVKLPWELSRCHHWVTLGRAYALDADPRYAREFVAQLDAWLDDNPWPYGVNWGRHILDNLEYADNNGNHYLSNGVGLLFLGVLLPDLSDADAWRKKGLEIVWGEMESQVHPDGVDFEQGIGYQGLVTEFWYSSVLL